MSDLDPKEPGYTSVAPIFLERGRSFVGSITSNIIMPKAKISTNITQLVFNLENDNDSDTFVIVLNESDHDQVLYCDPDFEDPWGGCTVAWGDIGWIKYQGQYQILFGDGGSDTWASNHYLKVDYEGGGTSDCINASYDRSCVLIEDAKNNNPANDTITLNVGGIINAETKSCSDDKFYVYDNSDCE